MIIEYEKSLCVTDISFIDTSTISYVNKYTKNYDVLDIYDVVCACVSVHVCTIYRTNVPARALLAPKIRILKCTWLAAVRAERCWNQQGKEIQF